jgi:SAM-dependent methyltransferase
MKNVECPSCAHPNTLTLARLPVQTLIAAYEAPDLGADIRRFVTGTDGELQVLQCKECSLIWYVGVEPGDGAFYEAMQKQDWYYREDRPEFEFASSHISPQDSVLEVGCGSGAFARTFLRAHRYRGLEFNRAACEKARASGLDVEIMDVEDEARAKPESYDVVCHFQVLEHVERPRDFMQACARLIRPGGRLIVAVPSEDSFIGLAESLWLNMPPHHLSRWPDFALSALFESVGIPINRLWHEPEDLETKPWRDHVAKRCGWWSLTGGKPQFIESKNSVRWMYRCSKLPGFGAFLIRRGEAAYPQLINGHSVVAIGQKPG